MLNKTDISSEPVQIQLVDWTTVQFDGSGGGIVPSFEKADDSALAGAGLTLNSNQYGMKVTS